jgi:hypothetical protein
MKEVFNMNYYTVILHYSDDHNVTHNFLSEKNAKSLTETYRLLSPEFRVTCREMTESEIVNG